MVYRIARELAASLLGNQEARTPLDLESECETLGIVVVKREMRLDVDGYQCCYRGVPGIVLNNSVYLPVTRKRWTLAHEIGEYLIANEYFIRIGRTPCGTRLHRAANVFARELLLPEPEMREVWKEFHRCPIRKRVAIVADRFNVSPSFVKVRMEQLQLS